MMEFVIGESGTSVCIVRLEMVIHACVHVMLYVSNVINATALINVFNAHLCAVYLSTYLHKVEVTMDSYIY
jgi:hypothetical protein